MFEGGPELIDKVLGKFVRIRADLQRGVAECLDLVDVNRRAVSLAKELYEHVAEAKAEENAELLKQVGRAGRVIHKIDTLLDDKPEE